VRTNKAHQQTIDIGVGACVDGNKHPELNVNLDPQPYDPSQNAQESFVYTTSFYFKKEQSKTLLTKQFLSSV
jgi:hypothetical protein